MIVHLVEGDDHLLHSEGEGQESVLPGLSVLGDSGLESSVGGVNNEDGAIGLGGSGNHVLDEIPMSWGINHGTVVLWGLELPEGNIDGDTSLPLGLQLVKTSKLVNQVSGSDGLSTIDVADDHDVQMKLFLSHGCCSFFFLVFRTKKTTERDETGSADGD